MLSNNKKLVVLLSLVLAVSLVAGCGGQQASQEEETADKEEAVKLKEVKFGYVNWPGVTMKTHVSKRVLETLGYEVTMDSYTQQVLFTGMENDEIDAFLGNWIPTMKVNFEPYKEKGVVVNVQTNLEEALYQTAVPEYVWEAGVKSMADLHKHAEKFDKQIVGIEPGNDGNQIIKQAIDNNTYNLKDWELVTGSTAAMLAAVGKATKNEEWIAFNGWEPHWMNVKYDIKYLKDPEGIWGDADRVDTAARPELEKEAPNFWKFLDQFKVTGKMQSKWILEYQEKERDPKKVADEWLANNLDQAKEWVKGMKSIDGKDAQQVLEEEYGN